MLRDGSYYKINSVKCKCGFMIRNPGPIIECPNCKEKYRLSVSIVKIERGSTDESQEEETETES